LNEELRLLKGETMKGWLGELDDLLRGRKTEPRLLAGGTEHLHAGAYLTTTVVLGATYGVFMGVYALLNRTPPCYEQVLASMAKVPALFLLTLVVTFPSLYVFSALLNTRLSLGGTFRVVMASLAVTVAVLASVGPITGFFSLTTSSYPFMKLLNFLFFAVAGVIGLRFLLTILRRVEIRTETKTGAPPNPGPAPDGGEGPADPGGAVAAFPQAKPAPVREVREKAGKVFRVWLILYALVGMQMGWVLRPFIGSPGLEFAWFRPRESNIFMGILRAIGELFSG